MVQNGSKTPKRGVLGIKRRFLWKSIATGKKSLKKAIPLLFFKTKIKNRFLKKMVSIIKDRSKNGSKNYETTVHMVGS